MSGVMSSEIQLDMFSSVDMRENDLAIMRTQRIKAYGGLPTIELALARIQVEPHAGQWMWAVSINSSNGAEMGFKPLPKWRKFASTRDAAIESAADELRHHLERLTADEKLRVIAWLGEILPKARPKGA